MKLIGLMPVRNEEWCLGLTARAALMWCDSLIILLHACTDDSPRIALEIAEEFEPRVLVVSQEDPTWNEMQHRQSMLELARTKEMGATHIAIIDADELLTGNLISRIRSDIEQGGPTGNGMLQLPGYNLRGSLNQYHANGIWGNRWFSVAFADDLRLGWSGDKFHSREPQGLRLNNYRPIQQGQGGVMHLWGASERRLIAKHAWYKLTERLRWSEKSVREIDELYSLAIHGSIGNGSFGTPENWTYKETKPEWWLPYAHLIEHLDVNAEPWQEQECIRLVKEYGPRMFAGLDLFGVV